MTTVWSQMSVRFLERQAGEKVLCHIKESVELHLGTEEMTELWVRIKEKARKSDMIVGVCYRPPNQED